jgi:hypothetical protein
MERAIIRILTLLILLALAIQSPATNLAKTHEKGDAFGISFVNGAGSKECREFVADFQQGETGPRPASIMLWLVNYCRENPLLKFADAANAYVRTVGQLSDPDDWN